MRAVACLVLAMAVLAPAPEICVGLAAPVDGPVVAGFAPIGRWAGHWGVDFGADPGTPVRAAGAGVVSFDGTVAGNRTVTIDHGGGLKTSYSYLETASAGPGRVMAGSVIARSGRAHGSEALHFSVRDRRCLHRSNERARVHPGRPDQRPLAAPSARRPVNRPIAGSRPNVHCGRGPRLLGVRRGILGGTFDPVHLGHLVAAAAARHQLELDEVRFIPAGDPWQKAWREVTPAAHRAAMTRLAVEEAAGFELDEREVARPGSTYTADTLAEFDRGDELILILGADAAAGLATWDRAHEVVRRARIAVAPRPGTTQSTVEEALDQLGSGEPAFWLDMPDLDVSGTDIRLRAAQDRPFRFLVPDPVWRYVLRHGLYESHL